MKRILGLDLGTTSIGWALVNEAESTDEKSSVVKIGVRVNPLTVDEQQNFEKGRSITTNADRTLKRSMRRNLQRYKLRRENLVDCLKKNGIITNDTILTENGNNSTFHTYRMRAKAAIEEVSLEDFARILLMINKKRGYKSSRKANGNEEGQLIDGMTVARKLYEESITPGQYVLGLLESGKRYVPDFYRSDLQEELYRIWQFQKQYHADMLTDELYQTIEGKTKTLTQKILLKECSVYTAENKGKDKRLQQYKWRADALVRKLSKEEVAYVIADVNGAINASSGYLGAISDRSKILVFNHLTVGQYQMQELDKNPHCSLRNMTFYRQDYLDEFEVIWEKQAQYHSELTPELKKEIRDVIIFYQRALKSKKGMLDVCVFENRKMKIIEDGKTRIKTIGLKVCPKSSPLFQEFRMWEILNNLLITDTSTNTERELEQEEKEMLARELTYKERLSKTDVLRLIFGKASKTLDLNYKEIEGNKTMTAMCKAYFTIVAMSGHNEYTIEKMKASEIEDVLNNVFGILGIDKSILTFDAGIEGDNFDRQPMYKLWHLLYSYEGDKSPTGNEALISKIEKLGFAREYASVVASVTFQDDYGNLSAKAIRKILPFMKEGNKYSLACEYAGYRHSKSLSKEELDKKEYKSQLELLPRNSLRNPVVEKILNQMINVVNAISATYGKPDEIRIELARELKKNAKERELLVQTVNEGNARNEKIKKILESEFGLPHVSKNDILRYRLYMELKDNGFKTLYSNTYIPKEKLFTKEYDIEHIIPQARLFDDSYSNKTLEARSVNIAKSNATAYDYILQTSGEEAAKEYRQKIDMYYKDGFISKAKHDKLLMREEDIPDGFIERDLRNSQYIAVKAREILEDMVRFVVPTVGSITERLRTDWQLVDVMQELNWNKYDRLGLTYTFKDRDGREIRRITGWTKRNDHRHHAMDALTIAFTSREIINYLNHMNARSDKSSNAYAIEQKYMYRDKHGKLRFNPPMPLDELRVEAKRALEEVFVSIKSKNKVMTQNVNVTKAKNGKKKKVQLTPRGQLHNETVYAHTLHAVSSEVKVDGKMDAERISKVASQAYRNALALRLVEYGGDPKKAFAGKNSIEKNPLWLDELHTCQVPLKVKIVEYESYYPVRKPITPDLKIEKVIDVGIRRILEARLAECDGDARKAFSNIDENPIWQNKEKGISIKSVRIRAVQNAVPLHEARDNHGRLITDSEGRKRPVDYVQTSGTHHVAIYVDNDGNLQDRAVSFFEATARKAQNIPVVDKDYNSESGWKFLFSMKQNEYFVFPDEKNDFMPKEVDLKDKANAEMVSRNLYRVQKLSKVEYGNSAVREYVFRHHLETTVEEQKELKDIAFKNIKSLPYLKDIVKVRINHIGEIVAIGEY